MTSAEAAICGANDVVHSEFLIAHRIVAFIAHPDAPLVCLDGQTLELALKPTSSNNVTDWSFYAEEQSDLAILADHPVRRSDRICPCRRLGGG